MAAAAQTVAPPVPPHGVPAQDAPASPANALLAEPPAPRPASAFGIPPDSVIARLPVEIEVGVPIRSFRVRNLLALQPGLVVASQWNHGEDLPLLAGEVQLAWTEFEVLDNRLGARITRMS